MDKDLLLQKSVQAIKKDQDKGLSTDDDKLKASAELFSGSYETLFNDFVTCNYIRGYN